MPDPISWAFVWPYFLAAFAGGYHLGSLPFGLLLTKMAGLGDIRQLGSGNIGTTNVLRTGRKDLAAATLLLDGALLWRGLALSWRGLAPKVPDPDLAVVRNDITGIVRDTLAREPLGRGDDAAAVTDCRQAQLAFHADDAGCGFP